MNKQTICRIATARQSTITVVGQQSDLRIFTLSYRIEDRMGQLIQAAGGIMVPGDGLVTEALGLVNRMIAAFMSGETVQTVK